MCEPIHWTNPFQTVHSGYIVQVHKYKDFTRHGLLLHSPPCVVVDQVHSFSPSLPPQPCLLPPPPLLPHSSSTTSSTSFLFFLYLHPPLSSPHPLLPPPTPPMPPLLAFSSSLFLYTFLLPPTLPPLPSSSPFHSSSLANVSCIGKPVLFSVYKLRPGMVQYPVQNWNPYSKVKTTIYVSITSNSLEYLIFTLWHPYERKILTDEDHVVQDKYAEKFFTPKSCSIYAIYPYFQIWEYHWP